jgi:hypothetical protein
LANKQIAHDRSITEKTAKAHLSAILGKLGLQGRSQAALYAGRIGLLPLMSSGQSRPRPCRLPALQGPLERRGLSSPSDDDLNSVRGFLPQKDQAEFGPLPDFVRTLAIKNVFK